MFNKIRFIEFDIAKKVHPRGNEDVPRKLEWGGLF